MIRVAALAFLVSGCFDFGPLPGPSDMSRPPDLAVPADASAAPDLLVVHDLACTAHQCGTACARGNGLGVGSYCTVSGDCEGKANICQTLVGPLINFCTRLCNPDGGVAECGDNALCATYLGISACYPIAC